MENKNNSIIKIEIDGIEFNAKKGSKIIEIADEVGIYIPRFCYHKKLSIAANCRMCLVEIEKAPKLFPACATPVAEGMKIYTNTEKVIDAQKSIMEFLLINHPLDCPICDQGGECELQDLTIGYGCASSRFIEKKRSFTDYDLGPLVATDVTRCILCSRCVRFCSEIAGTDEMGIIGRGSNSRIFTFLKENLKTEISGNIIDLCPVGALTAKPSRFKFRPWELSQHSSISHHDSLGSNIYVHTFRNNVIRIVPKKNDLINESWISDKDRFSYEALNNNDRIKKPIIKKNNEWVETTWEEAINIISNNITNIKKQFGPKEIGAISSPNSTVEEFYILQKFMRSIGSSNLDHRLKQIDFTNEEKFPNFLGLDIDLNIIENLDLIVIIGSNITKENPILATKIRKAEKNGCKIFILNPIDFNLSINIKKKYIENPINFNFIINEILKNIQNSKNNNNYNDLSNILIKAEKKLILFGSYVTNNPKYSNILANLSTISKLTQSKLGFITDGTNVNGALCSGFLPYRLPNGKNIEKDKGLNTLEMLEKGLKLYLIFNTELEHDSFYSNLYINAIKKAHFVIAFSSFKNKYLSEHANIILPITTLYEKEGTFINISGILQSFEQIVLKDKNIKHGWEAIMYIAKNLDLNGFNYNDCKEILEEFKTFYKNINKKMSWDIEGKNENISKTTNIICIPEINYLDTDLITRRASSLQKTKEYKIENIIKCNSNTYTKIKESIFLKNEDNENIKFSIKIDNKISDDCIFIENIDIIKNKLNLFPYKLFSELMATSKNG